MIKGGIGERGSTWLARSKNVGRKIGAPKSRSREYIVVSTILNGLGTEISYSQGLNVCAGGESSFAF